MRALRSVQARRIVAWSASRAMIGVSMLVLSSAVGVGQQRSTTERSPIDRFQVEEVTIAGLHRALQDGRTTCAQVVQSYIERARAYNGVCTALVTKDGAPIQPGTGVVRGGAIQSHTGRCLQTGRCSAIAPPDDEGSHTSRSHRRQVL